MSINFIESFYIRPKPSINNRSKHLNPTGLYRVIGHEEIESKVKSRNEKGQYKSQIFTNIMFYISNDLRELTAIDISDCNIELTEHNANKTFPKRLKR